MQIAMISPGMGSCDYTLNTLRYADRWCWQSLLLINIQDFISVTVKISFWAQLGNVYIFAGFTMTMMNELMT